MASDISLAVGDGTRRMTYAELAAVRGTSQPSAVRLVRRRGWPRQVGNDGVVRVLVPLSEARNASKSAVRLQAPANPAAAPDVSEPPPASSGHIAPASPGQAAPDDRGLIRGLESAIEALREQLVSERHRVDELQALLTQERRTSAPDTRGIIKEVIREIAGAAPPDDGDDDRQTLRTLESTTAVLREQLENERCRSAQAEARADRAERRIEELHERLTALLTRRQAGSVPSVQRPETTFNSRLPWRRWFR